MLPDADQKNLIDSVRWGIFFGAGQVCSAMSRLIVHESIHDDVLAQVEELAKKLKRALVKITLPLEIIWAL
ncbi:MAG: hypothetical protein CM15mP70_00840 [Pelagibacteraceae bacterium]|nr:MAG: hypothetical protein CM15mP70_00840 [Pelagibacteraceae bacterium]